MAIRNIPDELREKLVEEAKRNRRSLNQKIFVWLETVAGMRSSPPSNVEAELNEIRKLRRKFQPMSASEIDAAKQEGRA